MQEGPDVRDARTSAAPAGPNINQTQFALRPRAAALINEVSESDRIRGLLSAVTRVSHMLLADDQLETAMERAIARLGEAVGTDAVVLFRREQAAPRDHCLVPEVVWSRRALRCPLAPLSLRDLGAFHWIAALARQEVIRARAPDLPQPLRALLEQHHAGSIVCVPVPGSDSYWGVLMISAAGADRVWSQMDEAALITTAACLSAAIARGQAAQPTAEPQGRRAEAVRVTAGVNGRNHNGRSEPARHESAPGTRALQETVKRARPLLPPAVDLTIEVEHDLPPLDADRVELRQVLMNLLLKVGEVLGGAQGRIVVSARRADRPGSNQQECPRDSVAMNVTGRSLDASERPAPEQGVELTDREHEVLGLLAHGLTNTEIGAQLNISRATAKFHVSSILSKLGVATRTEAVALAVQNHLIDLTPASPPG